MAALAADRTAVEEERLPWLDALKAVALGLIFLNHAVERMGEFPLVANPTTGWPPFADRLGQLLTPAAGGWWETAYNVIRYPGLLGEVGVALFVIASGLGLTVAARRRGVGEEFLRRRASRIAPTWVVLHLAALAVSVPVLLFLAGWADNVAAPWDVRFWLSLAGLRLTPSTMYYLVPAWWFIALLLQLYLVFPLLFRWLVRLGPSRYWLVIAAAVAIKLGGLFIFDGYLPAWSLGVVFVTRLPEFAFGMLAATWLGDRANPLGRWWALPVAAAAVPTGIASSLTLAGNAWGPFLFGAGLFVLLYRGLVHRSLAGAAARAAGWVGRHSLSLFLVHQPLLALLLPQEPGGPARVLGGLAGAAILSAAAALCLEAATSWARDRWSRWRAAGVTGRRVAALAGAALAVYAGLVGADAWVRAHDPQEVLGWGERPSLQADDTLGWRLIPNQATRLRWQTYDYVVTANRFGFPGPAEAPEAGDLRILTLGDAFTSAEGVNTAEAWPRLLEDGLGRPATVWNGAVTGYGPRQYAAVAEELAPLLEPDVVVVEFFVNDFADAAADVGEMRDAIGFGQPDPTGLVPSLQWRHLAGFLGQHVTEPVLERLGAVEGTGYGLANFAALEPGAVDRAQYEAARSALARVRAAAPGARLVLMLVPASVQVCDSAALDYYPPNIDPAAFDYEQPQRLATLLAAEVGAEVLDLRGPLRAVRECPYQPGNMHWREEGHRVAADAVARLLAEPLA